MNRVILKVKLQCAEDISGVKLTIAEFDSGEGASADYIGHKSQWDTILMDQHLQLGGMLGSQSTEKLGQLGCASFIIACSANHPEGDVENYMTASADLTWPKPNPADKKMTMSLFGRV